MQIKTKVLPLSLLFNKVLEVITKAIRQEKEICISNWKK